MKSHLEHCSTLNLIKLAEHLVVHGQRDLGYALLLADIVMLLMDRLPVSAMARVKEDLRAMLDGREPPSVVQ